MSLLDRRRLLTSGAAAAVFAASGMPGLAMPKRGGLLRAGLSGGSSTDSWDGRRHRGLFMIAAAQGAVFDTLTEVAPDGSLRGELATQWHASADARVWTVDLRRDVMFHNGKSFSAEDVIASLRLHLDPAAASPARPLVATIIEMRTITSHQLRFKLARGNADFPYLLADYHLLMYPAGHIAQAMLDGIGTGLYKVECFEPGQRFLGRRVQSHYRDGQAGWFDEVDFTASPSLAARRKALEDRHIDVADYLSDPGLEDDNIRLQRVTGNQHVALSVPEALDSATGGHLARALKHGIDRQLVLDGMFNGFGRLAADSPVGPANRYYQSDLTPLPFDADRARYHLGKAKVNQASVAVMLPEGSPLLADATVGVLRNLALETGLNLRPVRGAMQGQAADLVLSLCYGRGTEDWMFSAGSSDTPFGVSGARHQRRFAQLQTAARSEMDSAKRADCYGEMQRIARDNGALVAPVFVDFSHAVHRRLASPERIGNLWPLDNARLAERWWMA